MIKSKLIIAYITGLMCAFGAHGQVYPSKPITAIFPYTSGTSIDAAMRAMYEEASKILGQPIVSVSRPGAGGRLGVVAANRAPADGYMMGLATDTVLTVAPIAMSDFKMEAGKDYLPVIMTHYSYMVLATSPKAPFKDLPGLIAYAKANPGKVNFASSGAGGTSHLQIEYLLRTAGVAATHIAYKGFSQALPDLLDGRVDLTGSSSGNLKSYFDSGKLVAIATYGPKRMAELPNMPTISETLPGFSLTTWMGLVTAPDTPRDIINKLNGALNTAIANPGVQSKFVAAGLEPKGGTPEEFADVIKQTMDVYAPLVRRLGVVID